MILTQQERDKFIFYLEQQAKDNKQLVNNLKQLPSAFPPGVVSLLETDAAAFTYVAAKLRMIEGQAIGK